MTRTVLFPEEQTHTLDISIFHIHAIFAFKMKVLAKREKQVKMSSSLAEKALLGQFLPPFAEHD